MKKRVLSIISLLLLAVTVFSACGQAAGNATVNTNSNAGTDFNGVASYVDGIAGSVSNGTILDWVYQSIPGNNMPASSAYKQMSAATTSTETVDKTTYGILSATNTTYLSLSGLKNPTQNSNQYYRLDYSKSSTYPGTLDTSDNSGKGVAYLATQTAGVTLRFCTNATSLLLKATMQNCDTGFNHMAMKGVYGFDVYVGTGSNRTWVTTGNNVLMHATTLSQAITLPSGYKEVMICFPQYGGVTSVDIGLPTSAYIAKPAARSVKDICFYGTSITQGACSNRAGTSFVNTLGRTLDANIRNLGFSGSGKGEAVMAEYIAGLIRAGELSCVVLDFERNGSLQDLYENHYNFYKILRAADANIPIIMVTRPIFTETPTATALSYHSVVANTYQRAVTANDNNIYMLNGYEYFTPGMADLYTVDNTHPNDLGHYFMANKLYPYLYEVLYGNPDNIPEPKLGEYSGYQSFYAPFGIVEGAKIATSTWYAGLIPTTKSSNTNYDQTTNIYKLGGMYSHTDILTFPKKGTKVWYSLDSYLYVSANAAQVSYVTDAGAFDTSRATIPGFSSNGFKIIYNDDGSVKFWQTPYATSNRQYFCYITQSDNEKIRFCANLNNNALQPTVYYAEPSGADIQFFNAENYTKTKVDVTWTGNKYLQWESGMLDQDMPFAVSNLITIPKAGTTIVWFDDCTPDPCYVKTTACEANRCYAGGTVAIAAFDSTGKYLPNTLRLRANNGNSVELGGQNCYVDTIDGKMRVYYYTSTQDNETVHISYHAGFDTDINNSNKAFYVPPYDVYMYVPKN